MRQKVNLLQRRKKKIYKKVGSFFFFFFEEGEGRVLNETWNQVNGVRLYFPKKKNYFLRKPFVC